jgi:hypothetical protein
MLDNPLPTFELLELMEEHLPIQAMIPPPLAKLLSEQQPDLDAPRAAMIREIRYLGDEGGIMCVMPLPMRTGAEHLCIVSLTNVKIDGRHPLSRRIAAYQRRRTKKISEERRLMACAESHNLLEYPVEYPINGPQM